MARGNKRGGNGGSNDRGRGQPSRGRGQRGRPFQRGGGGGAARNWREEELDLDFSIDIRDVVPRGFRSGNRNRGRGRGRGGGRGGLPAPGISTPSFTPYNSPLRGLNGSGSPPFPSRGGGPSQRGSPSDSGPKDRSRKRILDKKLRTGTTPLSQLLCRPYLRPIKFVRSKLTPYLFMDEEEIFKPVVEESGQAEASHVPTADTVLRVFKTGPSNAPLEDIESTDLEEIDFNDLHRAVAEIEEMAADKARWENQPKHQEEVFTGVYFDTIGSTAAIDKRVDLVEDPSIGPLGSSEVDDEVIVYIAPHPRSGRAASPNTMASIEHPSETEQPVATPSSPTIPSERLSTVLLPALVDQNLASSIEDPIPSSSTTKAPSPSPPLSITQVVEVGLEPEAPSQQLPTMDKTQTPPHRRLIRNPRGVLKQRPVRLGKRLKDHPLFGSFGAILSEARLRGERDPRRVEQRRGDSDVDWGSESEGETSGDEGGDMDVDPDIQLASMEQFVRGMGVGGSMHKSAGDLEDDAQIASEDESEGRKSSSTADGEDAQFAEPSVDANQPEALSGDNPSSSDDDDDDDDSPEGSFYARLRSLREQSADPRLADPHQADEFSPEFAWDEEEDDYPAWLEKSLAAHSNIDTQDPLSEDDELDGFSAPARRRRDKGKDLPPELQEQWKRDRAKKAEYKRQRDEARLLTAADSLAHRKGGKKGRKAARLAIEQERPNAVVDVNSLEQQMRRFLADLGGAKTMSLPPMAKESRKIVHELALAFNLKSHSKGNGLNRYTSLVKTSRSGIKVNEGKVTAVVRRSGGVVSVSGRGGRPHGPKPKEGDIVGKEAPKIGGSNIGFKMLSAMGWEDGDRIGGATGGLDVPLTAVVKMSKLGLGAAHKLGK